MAAQRVAQGCQRLGATPGAAIALMRMNAKKYLISSLGRSKYNALPKGFREKIERLDQLPPAPKPVTAKQLEKFLG